MRIFHSKIKIKNLENQKHYFGVRVNMEKGAAAILLTLLISSMILIIVLGVSSIIIMEIKLSRNIEESVMAFYAADAGAEKCLYEINTESGSCSAIGGKFADKLDNDATFEVTRKSNNSLSSTGKFKSINRKVELNW